MNITVLNRFIVREYHEAENLHSININNKVVWTQVLIFNIPQTCNKLIQYYNVPKLQYEGIKINTVQMDKYRKINSNNR